MTATPWTVLGALADPTRRQILELLAKHGGATATVIATDLPVSRQAVVKHLQILADAGVVSSRRTGREVHYLPEPRSLEATAHWMTHLANRWNLRLHTIKRIAESPDGVS